MRLLLAEDETELANALATILKRHNYAVDVVYNGEDALYYLETEVYDALILDIMMPKVDGIEVLRRIRSKGNNIPVLILTAKSEVEDKVLGLDTGADDYLTKPFSTQELLARIRAITRRRSEILENRLKFGDVELDRLTYELISKKNKVLLTSKEFQIMEMLMMNKNQMIPSERIMEKVWGYDNDVESNVVWTYISYLRKKLRILESTVDIKSVRNIGYMLEDTK
ncbi:MAG: response regulator transcription factor [Bacilli bacterium]|nr:response regulator transcription factor [Bacilli bacterium]